MLDPTSLISNGGEDDGGTARLSVLIVEDEAMVALNLEALVEETGFTVSGVAASSAQARRSAEETSPDLGIVDINLLDGRTGLALAEHLHARHGTVVIMATANPEAVETGGAVFAVLRKPYGDAALIAILQTAAAQAARRAERAEPLEG